MFTQDYFSLVISKSFINSRLQMDFIIGLIWFLFIMYGY